MYKQDKYHGIISSNCLLMMKHTKDVINDY